MKSLKLTAVFLLFFNMFSYAYAAPASFACPDPNQIKIINLSDPPLVAMWFAPKVQGAKGIGWGLGGSKIAGFLGSLPAIIDGEPGWICFYGSPHGPISEFEKKIDQIPAPARNLISNLAHLNMATGCVGYVTQ